MAPENITVDVTMYKRRIAVSNKSLPHATHTGSGALKRIRSGQHGRTICLSG